jgi:hypothetical protein
MLAMLPYPKPRQALRAWVPFLLLIFLILWALPARAEWLDRTESIMGTRIYVELWHTDAAQGRAGLDAVMAEMHRIDRLMSHYKPDSQLSAINARAAKEPVVVDPELFELLRQSVRFSELTEGAFDITYASVGYLYDYRKHVRPTDAEIRKALPGVNFRNMLLDEKHHSVRFEKPGMRIDLGGIAKGYAVDRGIELLQKRGVQHAVVTAGGDTRIIGDRLGPPWVIGNRHTDRDVHLRRLRALFRRGRGSLPPHHRSEERALRESRTQRHHPRPDSPADRRAFENGVCARPGEGDRDHRAHERLRCGARRPRRPHVLHEGSRTAGAHTGEVSAQPYCGRRVCSASSSESTSLSAAIQSSSS